MRDATPARLWQRVIAGGEGWTSTVHSHAYLLSQRHDVTSAARLTETTNPFTTHAQDTVLQQGLTCDTFTVRTSLTWGHRGGQSRVCGGSRVGSTQQWTRVMCRGQRRVARDLVTRRVVQKHGARQENPIREGQSGATGPGVVGTRCTQGHRSMGSNPRCRCPLDRGRTAVTRVWGFAGETWVAG